MTEEDPRPIHILLVEDNEGDVTLTEEALYEARIRNVLEVFDDGESAWERLQKGPMPDLVILDLKLPKLSGHDILQRMRSDDRFKDIIVVVATSSESPLDIEKAKELQADSYVTKPLEGSVLLSVVQDIPQLGLMLMRGGPDI